VLDIVDAMARLGAGARPGQEPILFVIGTPDPPAILQEIARRARAGGIADHIRVLPQQEDIQRWMQAADVLVSGSHQDTEGLSRVLFEAMACGAVPVATDIRGNREALTPETGILVPERDPDAIAAAVGSLIAASPERRAALRAAGLQSARERYDIRKQVRTVEAFLRDVVRGSLASSSGGDETSAHDA
jgi:glycosyltransferase involved in cell wall biosynthesis